MIGIFDMEDEIKLYLRMIRLKYGSTFDTKEFFCYLTSKTIYVNSFRVKNTGVITTNPFHAVMKDELILDLDVVMDPVNNDSSIRIFSDGSYSIPWSRPDFIGGKEILDYLKFIMEQP